MVTQKLSSLYSVFATVFLSMQLIGAAYAADKNNALPIGLNQSTLVFLPVGTEFTTEFKAKKLQPEAILRVTGHMPSGVTSSIEARHEVTFQGTVAHPQTCEISFRGFQNGAKSKVLKRIVNFSYPEVTPVYEGSISMIEETDTHIHYQITAQNNQGLPIVSATLRTVISGGAGGIFQNDSTILPEVAAGEIATATIWYEKGIGLVPPSLILNGQTELGPISSDSAKKTQTFIRQQCSYEEVVVEQVQ